MFYHQPEEIQLIGQDKFCPDSYTFISYAGMHGKHPAFLILTLLIPQCGALMPPEDRALPQF